MAMTSIFCSGAVISSLFYEIFQSSSIQEGFLLGKIEKVTSQNISDAQISTENTHNNICISSFYPLPGLGSFYSGTGKIDENDLKNILGRNFENIVGWYRYRGSCDEFYFKEMRITQKLAEIFSQNGLFTLGIISGPASGVSGTMDVHYQFSIILDGILQPIPIVIANMKDTSTSQYIRNDSTSSLYSSDSLQSILADLKIFEPAVKDVEKMHSSLLHQLRDLMPKYADVQEKYRNFALQVNKLRALCHSKGIVPEYQPKKEEVDEPCCLMEFESLSPKVKTRRSTIRKANTSEVVVKRKSSVRATRTLKTKISEEATEFVEKEDEAGSHVSKIMDENFNTLSSEGTSPRLSKRKSFRLQSSPPKTLHRNINKEESHATRSSSCDSSSRKVQVNKQLSLSPRKTTDSASPLEKSPYTGKIKSARIQNRSLERNSPIHTNRQKSPSKSSKEIKSKVKECWSNSGNL